MNVVPHHTLAKLLALHRAQKDPRLARRIHGVYLARTGCTCPQVMAATGAARRTVQQWVVRYNRGGLEALVDQPQSGRPTRLTRNREEAFRRRIEHGPTVQDGISTWTGPAVRRLLEREFGRTYSLWGVYDLLRRLGLLRRPSRTAQKRTGR